MIDYMPHQGQVTQNRAYLSFIPPPPLSHWVQSFWQLNVPPGRFRYRSVPDNCVDWIISCDEFTDNYIASPSAEPFVFELNGPVTYFGIRFRILGQHSLMTAPLGEWNDHEHTIHSTELLADAILNPVYACLTQKATFARRCQQVTPVLLSHITSTDIDKRLVRYIRYCHQNVTAKINLSDKQCSEFGLSARQLRRLSQIYLGVSPREFSRVLRFQYALHMMQTDPQSCTDGYYDQAHFIKEFKRLSGLTPQVFKQMSVLYNT